MKRSILARLRTNGLCYIGSALLILLVAPFYQIVVLGPTGFGVALNATGNGRYTAYLVWIGTHITEFILYRVILIAAFALLIGFPFALYRIIVAQEIMGQQELAEEDEQMESEEQAEGHLEATETPATEDETGEDDGMPAHAWRGKGFAVLAAWLGLLGLNIYVLSAVASTFYFISAGNPSATGAALGAVTSFATFFTISTNTVGTGLLGLGILFFGAMIVRTGRNLWPDIWVNFGYAALFVASLFCISAIGVISAPGNGQSTLTTIATLLFALWILWLGIMLVRLKPEA
jgi:hypothetical protein